MATNPNPSGNFANGNEVQFTEEVPPPFSNQFGGRLHAAAEGEGWVAIPPVRPIQCAHNFQQREVTHCPNFVPVDTAGGDRFRCGVCGRREQGAI